MENKKTFEYSYSAPTEEERREIQSIRQRYSSRDCECGKLERLRLLDSLIKNTAAAISIIVGIVSTLIFGLGMAMILEWGILFGGMAVSILGAVGLGFAYPIHKIIMERGKRKYGGEILKLSEELLNYE